MCSYKSFVIWLEIVVLLWINNMVLYGHASFRGAGKPEWSEENNQRAAHNWQLPHMRFEPVHQGREASDHCLSYSTTADQDIEYLYKVTCQDLKICNSFQYLPVVSRIF